MSLMPPGTYDPAESCTGSATPGAVALMSWMLGAYESRGARSGGIYNCRTVAGSGTRSVHSEGRACDLMIPTESRNDPVPWGDVLADRLRAMSAELGVQGVIYNRRQWFASYSASSYDWRPRGADHDDHVHVELTRAASVTLTAAHVEAILNGGTPPGAPLTQDALRLFQTMTPWGERVYGYTTTSGGAGVLDANQYQHLAQFWPWSEVGFDAYQTETAHAWYRAEQAATTYRIPPG